MQREAPNITKLAEMVRSGTESPLLHFEGEERPVDDEYIAGIIEQIEGALDVYREGDEPNLGDLDADARLLLEEVEEPEPDAIMHELNRERQAMKARTSRILKVANIRHDALRASLEKVNAKEALTLILNNVLQASPTQFGRLFDAVVTLGGGAAGTVFAACLQCNEESEDLDDMDVAIKIAGEEDDLTREAFLGFVLANTLTTICPNFIRTYAASECADIACRDRVRDRITAMVLELVKGPSMDDILDSLSERQLAEALAQILLALEVAYNAYRFTHYDLHTKNIIISRLPGRQPLRYYLGNVVITLTTDVLVRIIDYGLASAEYNGMRCGEIMATDGIYLRANPTYDVQRLLRLLVPGLTRRTGTYPWVQRLVEHIYVGSNETRSYTFPVMRNEDYLDWLGSMLRLLPFGLEVDTEYEEGIMARKLANPCIDEADCPSTERIMQDIVRFDRVVFNEPAADRLLPPHDNLLDKYQLTNAEVASIVYYLELFFELGPQLPVEVQNYLAQYLLGRSDSILGYLREYEHWLHRQVRIREAGWDDHDDIDSAIRIVKSAITDLEEWRLRR